MAFNPQPAFWCRRIGGLLPCGALLVLFASWCVAAQTAPATIGITAEQWDRHHTGNDILQIDGLNTLIRQWMALREKGVSSRIELHYPGGEEGEIWVRELADWLVALGIPGRNITSIPDSGEATVIRLTLYSPWTKN